MSCYISIQSICKMKRISSLIIEVQHLIYTTLLYLTTEKSELVTIALKLANCSLKKHFKNQCHLWLLLSFLSAFNAASYDYVQHRQWIDHICKNIWGRVSFGNEMFPSVSPSYFKLLGALFLPASTSRVHQHSPAKLHGNGWTKEK